MTSPSLWRKYKVCWQPSLINPLGTYLTSCAPTLRLCSWGGHASVALNTLLWLMGSHVARITTLTNNASFLHSKYKSKRGFKYYLHGDNFVLQRDPLPLGTTLCFFLLLCLQKLFTQFTFPPWPLSTSLKTP